MKIGGFNKASLTDYPGLTAAVIFTQGCNWRCPYCRCPELVIPNRFTACIPEEKVLAWIAKRKSHLQGIVVSGGEPTLQGDLIPFLKKLSAFGLPIKLDTNGCRPDVLREVFRHKLVAYVAMDIKAPFENYNSAIGTRTETAEIKASIWTIKNSGVDHEFRTTVIPGIHTVPELRELGSLVQGAKRFVLQEFVSSNPIRADLQNRMAFTRKTLFALEKYFRHKVGEFSVRTTDMAVTVPMHDETEIDMAAL